MNKKGFTLTEIILVLTLLLSVSLTSIISVEKIQEKSKEKRLNELITDIENAADVYINENEVYLEELLESNENNKCVRVYVLQNEGYLKTDLINPVTNKRIPANLCVDVTNEDGVLNYNFKIQEDAN